MSLIDKLIELYERWYIPYEDRRWITLCILKGTFTVRKQSHYDSKEGKWKYTEETIEVNYLLQYNNIGRYNCEILCAQPIPETKLRRTVEYIQIVGPWVEGQLDGGPIAEIYAENRERFIVPKAGCVLPPMKECTHALPANDRVVIVRQANIKIKIDEKTQGKISLAPGESLTVATPSGEYKTYTAETTTVKQIEDIYEEIMKPENQVIAL